MCIYTEIQSSTCEIQAANTCTNTLTILLQEDEMCVCVCVGGGAFKSKCLFIRNIHTKLTTPTHTPPKTARAIQK